MFTRRQFLTHTLQGSSLVALSSVVPQFVARTAQAAPVGKDNILVVVEMTGGNDGLNTVIPYADDLYHKARPTLRFKSEQIVRLDEHVGLHPAMQPLQPLWQQGQLAVVQGVGYPNPERSHFEAMDIWQQAEPRRTLTTGWLGRTVTHLNDRSGGVPILHLGASRLPPAVTGAPGGGAVTISDQNSFRLELPGASAAQKSARRQLVSELAVTPRLGAEDDLLGFVQRRQLQTLTAVEQLRELLEGPQAVPRQAGTGLVQKLQLVAGLIARGFGTRIFYVSIDGFDTHAEQASTHSRLLGELASGIAALFQSLKASGHANRVRLMTFSEFGRRVHENGSRGTDHGAASCLFVAGGSLQGGVVGRHPSLADLDIGDLKFHTDFRSVYATLLDSWLHCDSKAVLGASWSHIGALEARRRG